MPFVWRDRVDFTCGLVSEAILNHEHRSRVRGEHNIACLRVRSEGLKNNLRVALRDNRCVHTSQRYRDKLIASSKHVVASDGDSDANLALGWGDICDVCVDVRECARSCDDSTAFGSQHNVDWIGCIRFWDDNGDGSVALRLDCSDVVSADSHGNNFIAATLESFAFNLNHSAGKAAVWRYLGHSTFFQVSPLIRSSDLGTNVGNHHNIGCTVGLVTGGNNNFNLLRTLCARNGSDFDAVQSDLRDRATASKKAGTFNDNDGAHLAFCWSERGDITWLEVSPSFFQRDGGSGICRDDNRCSIALCCVLNNNLDLGIRLGSDFCFNAVELDGNDLAAASKEVGTGDCDSGSEDTTGWVHLGDVAIFQLSESLGS